MTAQILLISKMRIGCDQELEAFALGRFEQLTVL